MGSILVECRAAGVRRSPLLSLHFAYQSDGEHAERRRGWDIRLCKEAAKGREDPPHVSERESTTHQGIRNISRLVAISYLSSIRAVVFPRSKYHRVCWSRESRVGLQIRYKDFALLTLAFDRHCVILDRVL